MTRLGYGLRVEGSGLEPGANLVLRWLCGLMKPATRNPQPVTWMVILLAVA